MIDLNSICILFSSLRKVYSTMFIIVLFFIFYYTVYIFNCFIQLIL